MYKKIIRITICFENEVFFQALRTVSIPENCTVEFLEANDQGTCDVYFLNIEQISLANSLHQCHTVNSHEILVTKPQDIISESFWNYISDRWLMEKDLHGIKLRFKTLLQEFSLRHDCVLQHKYMEAIIDNSDALIWVKDKIGKHIDVNQSFCKAVGKTREQIRGRGHYYIWDLDYSEYQKGEYVCLETEETVMNSGKSGIFDETVKTKQGMRRLRTTKAPLKDEFGGVVGTVGIATDVTDILNLSSEIQMVIEQMPFGIVLYDEKGMIRNSNQKFRELTARSDGKVGTEKNINDIKNRLYSDGWQDVITTNAHHEMVKNYGGNKQWFSVNESELKDVFGKSLGYLLTFQDVTIDRIRTKTFEKQAMTDALTGIGNRRFFYYKVQQIRENGLSEGLIFMDLNKFKQLNDDYGHDAGDQALKDIAEILKQIFKGPNFVFSRYGGDEFVIYLKGLKLNDLDNFLSQLSTTIKTEFEHKPINGLNASLGAVFSASGDHHLDLLINAADGCMYEAKKNEIDTQTLVLS